MLPLSQLRDRGRRDDAPFLSRRTLPDISVPMLMAAENLPMCAREAEPERAMRALRVARLVYPRTGQPPYPVLRSRKG